MNNYMKYLNGYLDIERMLFLSLKEKCVLFCFNNHFYTGISRNRRYSIYKYVYSIRSHPTSNTMARKKLSFHRNNFVKNRLGGV